jgi:hypothetical protein
MMFVRRVLTLICLGIGAVGPAAHSQAPNGTQPAGPILYRQHLMAEELIAEQGAGYLPMQRARFDAAVQQRSKASPSTMAARLAEATYRARMTSDDVLIGTADYKVTYDGKQPAPLSLAPCGLAIGKLRWNSNNGESEVTAGISMAGDFRAIVDRSGTLSFPWSLRGSRTVHGAIEFGVRLPACPRNHMVLELPSQFIPRAPAAIVQQTSIKPDIEGNRIWTMDIASSEEFTLQLETPQPAPDSARPIFVRESLTYRLTNAGVELAANYHLEVNAEPIREILFEVPTAVQVASATIADKPALLDHISSLTDVNVFRASFPELQRGADLELVIMAVGPVQTGQNWQLPSIRLWDAQWQSGTAAIEIVEPLTLTSVDHRGSIARKVEPLPQPDRGELRQFQSFSPDREWTIWLAENVQEFRADTGLSLRFAESVVTGQLVADIQAVRGDAFQLRALVQPGWIIDTVQTDPPESFEGFQATRSGQQTFDIKLKQALNPDRKIRVSVRGHRRNPVSNRLANLAGMQFVQLEGVRTESALIALGVEAPLRLSLTGDQEVLQVAARDLTVAEATRINASPESVIFRGEAALNEIAVTQAPELPRYTAQVTIEARVDSHSLTQAYDFQIAPESSRVTHLRVRIADAAATILSWELMDAGENSLSARQLDSQMESTDYQEWELTLVRPLDSPFRVRATTKNKLGSEAPIGLASVPEASAQTGIVRLVCSDGSPLDIVTKNVQSLATSRAADGDIQTMLGTYRYVPSQDASVQIRRASSVVLPTAWIWFTHLSSRVSGAGDVRHEARLYLESKGLSSLSLDLPEGASLWSVSVDGVHVDADSREVPGRLAIPLPRGHRFPTVSVTFVTKLPTFSLASHVNPAWPSTSLTCLQRQWDVWTPADMQVAGAAKSDDSWDERLFGFQLVRRHDASFNPFRISDWRSLRQPSNLFGGPTSIELPYSDATSDPWTKFPADVGSDEFAAGWKRFSVTSSGAHAPHVVVYSRRALQAGGWGLLSIVVGLLCSLQLSRVRLLGVTTIAAAMVLLLPLDWLPLFRGVFYGASLAFLYAWVPMRVPFPIRTSTGASTSSYRGEPLPAGTASFIGISVLLLVGHATAQRPEDGVKLSNGVVHPVLIPVDDQQQPTGEYVYVAKNLFDELLRGSTDGERTGLGPLITAAHYEMELAATAEDPENAQLRLLRVTFDLSAVPLNGLVRLSFRRDRVRVSDVRIDDQPVPFQWSDDGQSLRIVSESEDCRTMTVILRPVAAGDPNSQVDIPIPEVPRSRLTIRTDLAVDRVQVHTVRGSVAREPNVVTADLGPANALRVSWGRVAAPEAAPLTGEVAELVWMHLQPNSTVVRAQFKLALRDEDQAEFVDLDVDPRLRLLPGNEVVSVQELQLPGKRVLRCRLADPAAKETTIELSFALAGGLGNLRVPMLSANVERHATRLLAVTAADGFEAAVLPAQKAKPIPVADFVRAWGRNDEVPQLAVALDGTDEVWQVSVRPRGQQTSADQQVELLLGQGRVSIAYESVVVVEQGSLLQQRFRVPAGFEPREVVAIHDDINRVLRWTRVDSRTVTVFFTSPLAGTYRIWIRGEMKVVRNGRVEIPVLAAELEPGKVVPVKRVKVLYRNDVQPKLVGSPGLVEELPTARTVGNSAQGRQLAELVARDDIAGEQLVQVNLTPNRPRLRGSMVTVLNNKNGRWWADVSIHLQVIGGYVDDVRLRFPAELEFPSEVTPKIDLEEVLIPGEHDRQLVAHLPTDDRHVFSLRMQCAFKEQEDEAIYAPDIRLPDADQLQRFILLPKLLDRTPLAWETSGLQAAELPPNQPLSEETVAGSDVYQIVGPHMTAQLKSAEPIQGSPQVRLADYRVQWFDDRRCHGLAAFDIVPAGVNEVTLDVPNGLQLVNVSVGTVPVSIGRIGEQRWRIPLGTTSLPQRIEVVFHGLLGAVDRSLQTLQTLQSSQTIALIGPTVLDLPCGETFWTVQGPAQFGEGTPTLTHTRTGRVDLAKRRLDTARQLVQSAPTGVGREGANHVEPWRANRQHWLEQLDRELFRARSAEDQTTTIAAREASADTIPRYDLSSTWGLPRTAAASTIYTALRGSAGRIEIRYPGSRWRTIAQRLIAVSILIAVVVVLLRMLRAQWVRELLMRYPQFAVGVFGFAWWLWLIPSVAGFAMIVLTALISLRSPWKTKTV